jgi:hypothetical protein
MSLSGSLDQDRRALAKFAEAGVEGVSIWVAPRKREVKAR